MTALLAEAGGPTIPGNRMEDALITTREVRGGGMKDLWEVVFNFA